MADATYDLLELRVVIEPELTHLYVRCGPTSDGTLGVQGWHRRTLAASQPDALQVLRDDLTSYAYLTSQDWAPAAPSDG